MDSTSTTGGGDIDLRDETLLVESLVRSTPRRDYADKDFAMFVIEGDDPHAELGRMVEAEVFFEAFGDQRELLDETYGPYNATTHFIVLVDLAERRVAGAIRYLIPGVAGFRTELDFQQNPTWAMTLEDIARHHEVAFASDDLIDVLTLSVRRDYNRAVAKRTSLALMFGLHWQGLLLDKPFMIGILDEPVFRLLNYCGIPAQRCCDRPSTAYLGSAASVPFLLDVFSIARSMRDCSPTAAAIVVDGEPLDDLVSLPSHLQQRRVTFAERYGSNVAQLDQVAEASGNRTEAVASAGTG